MNLGALLAPLICGTLGETLGWHYGFGAAGVGMLAGLVVYTLGGRHLPKDPPKIARARAAPDAPARANGPLLALLVGVFLCVVVFRGAYEQVGNTVALWADQGVDRGLGGHWAIPMTWFQSLNPLLVFVLTPLFLAHWNRQSTRGREPSTLIKMAFGAGGVALAFLMLALASALAFGGRAHWIWLAGFFALLTAGELYILPVGLGLFARLAPAGMAATSVAAWFFASFAGNLLAGVLGTLWSRISATSFFGLMAAVAGLSALLLVCMAPMARRAEQAEETLGAGQ